MNGANQDFEADIKREYMDIKICRFIVTVVCMLSYSFSMAATKPNDLDVSALYGRWHNTDATFYFSDGAVTKSPFKCWMEFSKTRIISECLVEQNFDRAVYIYRIVGPGKYEAKTIENKKFPSLIGTIVKSDFRIENDKLIITSYPPQATGGGIKMATKVEFVYIRDTKNNR